MKWKKLSDNEVLNGKGFYISYNSDTSTSKMGLGMFLNKLGGLMGGLEDDGRAETALVKKGKKNVFYILNGDFRKQYEKLFPSFNKCLKFFMENKENWSKWSTGIEESLEEDKEDNEGKNLCGKPHNNCPNGEGEENCAECMAIKLNL